MIILQRIVIRADFEEKSWSWALACHAGGGLKACDKRRDWTTDSWHNPQPKFVNSGLSLMDIYGSL